MTYPSGQQNPAPWGQPGAYGPGPSAYAQEIAPLEPPPKSKAGWLVIALVAIAGLIVGTGLLISVGREGVAGTAVAASANAKAPATTSTKPTTTTAKPRPKPGARLSYADYEGPWNFKMGGVEMHADWVEGRDHDGCAAIEKGGRLTGLGCQYAAEMVLSAEGGGVKITQFVLGMRDAAAAEAAASQIEQKDLNVRPGTVIDDFATGKWKAGAEKEFVVVTLATATSAVDSALVEKYLKYRHTDIIGAILFR
ncbi:hypothetical protein ACTWPB_01365 [Nocardia sp. IBHARD005]|uniref:hypothetical protein n=1 Tax=Nocardia sp. IBHARD005 TaxID=3457765 RepID=UPI0040581EBA